MRRSAGERRIDQGEGGVAAHEAHGPHAQQVAQLAGRHLQGPGRRALAGGGLRKGGRPGGVEDDVALLRQYTDKMPASGHILITVPAFQTLWSGHDLFLEHYRRYNKKQLEETIRAAGLKVVHTNYFFATLLPLVALSRLVNRLRLKSGKISAKSDLKIYPPAINQLLTRVRDLERYALYMMIIRPFLQAIRKGNTQSVVFTTRISITVNQDLFHRQFIPNALHQSGYSIRHRAQFPGAFSPVHVWRSSGRDHMP